VSWAEVEKCIFSFFFCFAISNVALVVHRNNAAIAAEMHRLDYERQQQWEAEQAAKREAE
jgi:hypothetical protein